jgi:hypothetical protein
VRRPEKRKPAEQARLDAIRAGSDELKTALDLADEFAELIRKRSQGTLSDWLIQGESCLNPELRRFAEGSRRDEAAVLAAVTQPWSHGPVEGDVNRLKVVKRQRYGRAGFVLLSARVVRAPERHRAATLGLAPKSPASSNVRENLAPRSSGKEEESPYSETFHRNSAGSNPARQSWDQQPEASLAWGRVTAPARRRQPDQRPCD